MTSINDYDSSFDIVKMIADIQKTLKTVNSEDVVADNGTVVAAPDPYAYNKVDSVFSYSVPTGLNMTSQVGTVWYDLGNNEVASWWDGFDWHLFGIQRWHGGLGLESIGPAMITHAVTSIRVFKDASPGAPADYDFIYDTATNTAVYRLGGVWNNVTDLNMRNALQQAVTLTDIAPGDINIKVWYQPSTPTAEGIGDLWYDSANDFLARRWNGTAWVSYGGDARSLSGLPPASVQVTIRGSATALTVMTTAQIAADTVLDYYISTVSGFTPTTGTRVSSTKSTINVITALADGTLLQPDVSYYVKVIARNDAGSAIPSTEVTGKLDLSVASKFIVDEISTGFLLTGRIEVGGINFVLDADEGLIINQTDGSVIHFPRDGSPATITAHLIARSLLVENGASIQGESLLGGEIRLGADIESPDSPPSVSFGYEQIADLAGSLSGSGIAQIIGIVRNIANDGWVVLGNTLNFGTSDAKPPKRINISDAGVVVITTLPLPTTATPSGGGQARGITKVGSNYHITFEPLGNGASYQGTKLFKLDSSFNVVLYRDLKAALETTDISGYGAALTYDGTNLRIAYGTTGAIDQYNIKEVVIDPGYTAGTTTWVSRTTLVANHSMPYGTTCEISGYYYGTADYGANRYVLTFRVRGSSGRHGAYVLSAANTRVATAEWSSTSIDTNGNYEHGLFWDGTNFFVLTSPFGNDYGSAEVTVGKIFKLGATPLNTTYTASYTWQNAAATITTAESPTASGAWAARRIPTITGAPAPQESSVDPNAANRVAIYAAKTGSRYRQASLAAGIRGMTVKSLVTSGTIAPTVNGFAGLGTPGLIRSTKTDGSGPLISFKGDGSWTLGDTKSDASGFVTPKTSTWTDLTLVAGVTGFARYKLVAGIVYFDVGVAFTAVTAGTLKLIVAAGGVPAAIRPVAVKRFVGYNATIILRLDSFADGSLAVTPLTGSSGGGFGIMSYPVGI